MPGPPPCPCIERKSSIRLRISSDIPPRVADGESERPVGPERRLVEPAPRELPDDDDVTTALSPMIVVNADFIAVGLIRSSAITSVASSAATSPTTASSSSTSADLFVECCGCGDDQRIAPWIHADGH